MIKFAANLDVEIITCKCLQKDNIGSCLNQDAQDFRISRNWAVFCLKCDFCEGDNCYDRRVSLKSKVKAKCLMVDVVRVAQKINPLAKKITHVD
ncbi:MAG: hypothetical protein EBX41_03835 [Chitinophagia bacterium]|nr:hypothetical protein [Chitinophagia bacterium]